MKGIANHASKAYEFSHFMPFSEPVHSQQPLAREGKIISSTSFAASTSITVSLSVYEIEIQGDSDLDQVPPSNWKLGRLLEIHLALRRERPMRYVMQYYLFQRDAIDSQ